MITGPYIHWCSKEEKEEEENGQEEIVKFYNSDSKFIVPHKTVIKKEYVNTNFFVLLGWAPLVFRFKEGQSLQFQTFLKIKG